MAAELSQQLGAEGVDRSALHALNPGPQLPLEPRRDFACCLVGEGEHADAFGVERALLDEESNPFDQAECLACAGAGENQNRLGERLDRLALRVGWDLGRVRSDRRGYGDDRVRCGKARDGRGQVWSGCRRIPTIRRRLSWQNELRSVDVFATEVPVILSEIAAEVSNGIRPRIGPWVRFQL